MRGDIGQIQVGKAPEGTRTVPVPAPQVQAPVAPRPTIPARIAVPEETGKKRGHKTLFVIIALLGFLVLVFIISSLLGGETQPTPTPTPSVSASLSPSPAASTLAEYFGRADKTITTSAISGALDVVSPTAQHATPITVVRSTDQQQAAPNEILVSLFADVPLNIESALIGSGGNEGILLAYGQTELFDAAGQPRSGNEKRPILVFEIDDATRTNQQMQAWESAGFATSATGPFDVDTSKAIVQGFASGSHSGISVRYWNFPYADRSIDWGIVLASNGKNYLVIAGSRQSVFFAIDRLLE